MDDPASILSGYSTEEIARAILELPPEMQSALAADAARKSFAEFVRQAWHIVEPEPLVWGWHLDAICMHLEAVTRGDITRLLINIPPGHAKSLIVSVLWPAWIWIDRPQWRSLFASYAAELSVRDSVRCRQVIQSEWYQYNFAQPGGWQLRDDQNVKHNFVNTRSGHRYATSVGGGGTGHRGDLVAIDDPLNALDAYSKAARDEANRWLGQTMSSRLNDMATGRMVIIMQRLHEEDPSGFVLAGGGWEHLCLPSEFEPNRRAVTYHWVTRVNGHVERVREEFWRDPREQDGELLFPVKFSREVLEAARAPNAMGVDGYAGQHQQRPAPAGGGMFRVQNWRFWKHSGAQDASAQRPTVDGVECYRGPATPLDEDALDDVVISVDATFRKTKSGSFVAIHVWGKKGARRCLLDRVHERMDFSETVKALLSVIGRWPNVRRKLIEAKANGDAIADTLEKQYGIAGIERVSPGDASKEQRAYAMQPYQVAGNVELPDGAPWLAEYIAEHAAFPNGGHDDDVDAQSQALQGLEHAPSTFDLWGQADLS